MKLRVLFFSILRDITGCEEVEWSLPAPATVDDLLNGLYQQWPALQAWEGSLLIGVDLAYVKRNEPLHEGAEVALMPPVQGG
jgi:molybdopterin converting factor small subunit